MSDSGGAAANYRTRAERFDRESARHLRRSDLLSHLRLALFLGGIFLVALAADHTPTGAGALLCLVLVAFARLVLHHDAVETSAAKSAMLARLNAREADRLEGKRSDLDPGLEFADPDHPYSDDLDLFGHASLFAALSRATTLKGRTQLAGWLMRPAADATEARARQVAVRELAPLLDWRQEFEARGRLHPGAADNPAPLLAWATEPPVLSARPAFSLAVRLLPPLTLTALLAAWTGTIPAAVPELLLLVQLAFIAAFERRIASAHAGTARQSRFLRNAAGLIAAAEEPPFVSPLLVAIRERLASRGEPASAAIARLADLADWFDLRRTMIHLPINALFLYDANLLLRLERWKSVHGTRTAGWFDAISELEALASLAVPAHDHPDRIFPDLTGSPGEFVSRDLGHPLLPDDRRVANDVCLPTGRIAILTGSNMAGKSTLLRAIGVNAALAWAGAPVCASSLRIGRVEVRTSLHTRDSLERGVSSFLAELDRLATILDAAREGRPILFLLDEILKGTNSRDRSAGGHALLRALRSADATGIAATHDLDLAGMAEGRADRFVAWRLDGRVEGDQIAFDYRLRPGVSDTPTALPLMASRGIPVAGRE